MAFTRYPRSVPSYTTMLHLPSWNGSGQGLRPVLIFHGHGGDALTAQQGGSLFGHPVALADAGFAVMSVDMSTSWSSDTAMAAATAMYNDLLGLGCIGPVCVMGSSMGGGASLVWAKQNPTKVRALWLWSPATDLDWVHGTAGYTPAYDAGGLSPSGIWAAEVDSMYGGNYAVNAVGHKIHDEYATWRNICPIRIAHATDDNVVPFGASLAFVAGADSPQVTLRTPNTTGGHTGAVQNVPPAEVVAFFQTALAAA